jgi:hypothetical protein
MIVPACRQALTPQRRLLMMSLQKTGASSSKNSGTLEEFLEGAVTVFDELMTNFPFGHNKK